MKTWRHAMSRNCAVSTFPPGAISAVGLYDGQAAIDLVKTPTGEQCQTDAETAYSYRHIKLNFSKTKVAFFSQRITHCLLPFRQLSEIKEER
jgi:hypothetical protein